MQKMHLYMDYTILTIKVKNNTQNTICLDAKQGIDTMYLYDDNRVRYSAFLNENSVEELTASRNMEITVNIKFNKMYNPSAREITGLVIKELVTNYDKVVQESEEKKTIEVDVKM